MNYMKEKKEGCYLMEYRYDDNLTNLKATKYVLEHTFDNLRVNTISVMGSGYDSVAYLVNEEYIYLKLSLVLIKRKGMKKKKRYMIF